MSEHTVSEIPTPMEAIKQIYELFQHFKNFTMGSWARDYLYFEVTTNDAHACCWCLGGAVFRVYNVHINNMTYEPSEPLSENATDTFKLLWEKLPAGSKFHNLNTPIGNYIEDITEFNDMYGYAGVMRLLQAIIDDTEYTREV